MTHGLCRTRADDDEKDDDEHTPWPEQKSLAPRTTEGSRRTAVSTGPNPQGSFVYDPIEVEAKGYEEGFAYALTWSPGKPVPAAHTPLPWPSATSTTPSTSLGYKAGVPDAIATLAEFQGAFASAHKHQVLSARQAADPKFEVKLAKKANKYIQPSGGGKYKIVQKGTGKTLSEHDSKEKAEAAFRAMEWSKHSEKLADANTRQFNDLDQEVAFPYTWQQTTGVPTSTGDRPGGGQGAADVANVPTPGQSVADYPQPTPTHVDDPAVGTDVTQLEPVLDTEDDVPAVVGGGGEDHAADPEKLAAVQALVRRRLGFSQGRRVTADDRPTSRQAAVTTHHPFKAADSVVCSGSPDSSCRNGGEAGQPHCHWCNKHWDDPIHNAKDVEQMRKVWASKTAGNV